MRKKSKAGKRVFLGWIIVSLILFLSNTGGSISEVVSLPTATVQDSITPSVQVTPNITPTTSRVQTATFETSVSIPEGHYVMASDNNTDSWVLINGDTGMKYQIKNGLYNSISPNGNKVAYWENDDYSKARLVIHNRISNKDHVILNTEKCGSPLTWSPDETKIALRCGLYDVHILDLINGRITKITEGGGETKISYVFPVWSPDGKSIALIKGQPGITTRTSPVWGITIVSSNCYEGETPCNIARGPFLFDLEIKGQLIPYWSPDSRYVAAFDQSGTQNVYLVDIITGEESVLTNIKGGIIRMSWASDSQSIVVASIPPDGRILVVSTKTGEEHVIWEGEHSMGIAWSPDGEWIAAAHEGALYLYSPENGERKKLIDGDYIIEKWVEIP